MKTTVYIGTSLDGFIARENGEIDWLEKFADAEVFGLYNEFIKKIDVIVIGRGTFEKVLGFPSWPYKMKVFVMTNSIKEVPDTIKNRVTILSMKPSALLDHLSGLGFSNAYIDGGKVIQSFLQEDLIDEMIISKVPVLLGTGIPLFGPLYADLSFTHIQTTTFSNGLVSSRYERKRN